MNMAIQPTHRGLAAAVVVAAALCMLPAGRAQDLPLLQADATRFERANRIRAAIEQGLSYVPGDVLVRFKPGSSGFANAQALGVLRTELTPANARWLGDTLHLMALTDVDPLRAAEDLARQPEVEWAQPNYINSKFSEPNDTGYSRQWNIPAINVPGAWDINSGAAADVIIAVLDSGFTTTEGSFGFRIWTPGGFGLFAVPMAKAGDFDHARVLEPVDLQSFGGWVTTGGQAINFDANGHGTHVAATIAQQTNNGTGFAGVAHGARLLPIKVCFSQWDAQLIFGVQGIPGFVSPDLDGCETAAVVEGLRYAADQGAKIINLSLGGPGVQPAMDEALRYAVNRGAFIAIAAGNTALQGNPTNYPAAYAPELVPPRARVQSLRGVGHFRHVDGLAARRCRGRAALQPGREVAGRDRSRTRGNGEGSRCAGKRR
jgi:serine protease